MKTFLVILAAFVVFSAPALAVEHQGGVKHYEGVKVDSAGQALTLLKDKSAEIATILGKDTLEGSDLEKIHEISYSLENGIDFLIAGGALPVAKTDAVDEAVQAVHNNSENHKEDAVREWFPKLEARIASLESDEMPETADQTEFTIVIKDHQFAPAEIHAPAGEKLKLIVENQDPTPEEFESNDLRREKIIAGQSKATILVGPLEPGKYHFYGEFNADSANGYLIVD